MLDSPPLPLPQAVVLIPSIQISSTPPFPSPSQSKIARVKTQPASPPPPTQDVKTTTPLPARANEAESPSLHTPRIHRDEHVRADSKISNPHTLSPLDLNLPRSRLGRKDGSNRSFHRGKWPSLIPVTTHHFVRARGRFSGDVRAMELLSGFRLGFINIFFRFFFFSFTFFRFVFLGEAGYCDDVDEGESVVNANRSIDLEVFAYSVRG